jgi:uncharacterized protein YbcC (UPF0753/DUF2309 family)
MQSSMESIAHNQGKDPSNVASLLDSVPKVRPKRTINQRRADRAQNQHASRLAHIDQQSHLRKELEQEYQQSLLSKIGSCSDPSAMVNRPELQVWTCIDDRNEGLRRQLEAISPNGIETLGVAGFFGVPVKYQSIDGGDVTTLAPVGNKPEYTLVEKTAPEDAAAIEMRNQRRKMLAQMSRLQEDVSFTPLLSLIQMGGLFPLSIAKMLLLPFPTLAQKMTDSFERALVPEVETTFDLPFPEKQAAAFLANTFLDSGNSSRFANLVVVLGHGSASANNPFFTAYQCGACQGRDGKNSARLVARLGNDKIVRTILASEHGITIPEDTHFIGAGHNTSSDRVQFFDVEQVPDSHLDRFEKAKQNINEACGMHALERSQRFMLDTPAPQRHPKRL